MNRILSDLLIIGTFSIATSSTTSSSPIIYTRNDGNVGIGTSTPTSKLYIKGSDSTSSNDSLKIDNSSNSLMFSVRNDGFVVAGNSSANSYLWVNGLGGQLGLTSENSFSYLLVNSANNKFYISNGSSGSNTFAQINTSNGNWLIGSPNTNIYTANLTDTKLTIQSVDSGSSNYALKINNSLNNELLYVRNDGNVGIKNATASYALHVLGTVSTTGFRMTNGASTSYLMISDSQGNASWTSSVSIGFVTASGTINYLPKWESSNGLSSTSNVYDDGTVVMIGATDSSLWSDIGASLPSFGKFAVYANSGSLETYGIVSTSVANGSLHVPGNNYAFYANPSGTARMYGFYANLTASNPSRAKHGFYANVSGQGSTNYGYYSEVIGGSNNVGYYAIMSSTNSSSNIGVSIQMSSTTGSNTGIYIDSSGSSQSYGIRVNKGTSIFNEFGDANTDFQIEGDTQPYLFFVDASVDRIGINNATPSYALHILGTTSTTGFRMTNGSATNSILSSNGTGDSTWSTLSSLNIATGSGTSNYLPRWTSTTALSSTSSLYDDGIDVGIATTSVGRGRLSIVPRGASAAVYISNTTNNSYITYRANTATYSMGVDYDATNPYFAISGGPSSYTTGALGSFDRMRLYNDSMHLIINATSSTVGPASVSNIRKGELVISNFNSISSAHTGKAYTSVILVGGTTTTTIARELKTDGVTASSNKITIPTDTTSAFVVNIQGQSDSNSTTCYFATIRGLVQNYTSSLTILGSTTSVVYNDMSGSASVSVDGTSLQILAQTTTSQIARWVARVEMTTLTQIGEIP